MAVLTKLKKVASTDASTVQPEKVVANLHCININSTKTPLVGYVLLVQPVLAKSAS